MPEELVPIAHEGDVYVQMDRFDEDMIKAEIENRVIETWVYMFRSGGRMQTGLSKVGVDACCTYMALKGEFIRESEPQMSVDPTDPEYILFHVSASRVATKTSEQEEVLMEVVNGVKRQWTKMKVQGQVVDDPFWYEKGVMKAARNARGRLIPEDIKTHIIDRAMDDKQNPRVQEVGPQSQSKSKTSKPAAAEKAASPKTQQLTNDERDHLWKLARAGVDHNETKARANMKKLLDFVGVSATIQLKPADYKRVCAVLETGEIPKEWEGKLEWGDKPAPKPEPTPKNEAPF